ncbi:serine/threonine protein kinase [Ktedonospora formicarum]|nr:serine/threonine-protein kinase [Ktedonospora formicarum]
MNAEALIGRVLGTCTLQKLIGQGGMGAVYLAQQSRPRRQVAVKVLMPMSPLNSNQLAAFLERFRRETDAAASLDHPNIVPVHEYGEQDGLAYLVMPYASAGTLRDELERMGPLPLDKATYYLEQLAAALDHAHEHGVIHRDIKPANILMTPEERLLLTDFGLVKIVAEGYAPQVRLTGEGVPVGTPDYMAPEQVIGGDVDERADLYSLGIILFQMLTGTTPFQGETPMQIAAQQLQVPPPSPQALRPDLPVAGAQVLLKALAKKPIDRYPTAVDFAISFRNALLSSHIQLGPSPLINGVTSHTGRIFIPKGMLEPSRRSARQTQAIPVVATQQEKAEIAARAQFMPGTLGTLPSKNLGAAQPPAGKGLLSRTARAVAPAAPNNFPVEPAPAAEAARPTGLGGGLLSRTGKFPLVGANPQEETQSPAMMAAPAGSATQEYQDYNTQFAASQLPSTPRAPQSEQLNPVVLPENPFAGSSSESKRRTGALSPVAPGQQNTGALMSLSQQQGTGALTLTNGNNETVKLTGPVKVVKVPVAGQPGRYVTGILPVIPADENASRDEHSLSLGMKIVSIAVATVLILLVGAGIFWYMHSRSSDGTSNTTSTSTSSQQSDTNTQGTDKTNILLQDPLDHNSHGWQESPADTYAFKDGAYHITNHADSSSISILQVSPYVGPITYSLSARQIKGDMESEVNTFGLIFRFSQVQQDKKTVTHFYTFEVLNKKGGSYRFWKYDDSSGNKDKFWTQIGKNVNLGNEFHIGQDAKAINKLTVTMNGSQFTFWVNGKKVMEGKDSSFTTGSLGMFVNLKDSEVAFKDLLVTRGVNTPTH